MNKVIAFLPIGWESNILPHLAIRSFCGQPLIYWILKELQACESIHQVVLASNDEKVRSIAKGLAFSKVLTISLQDEGISNRASLETLCLACIEKTELTPENLIILLEPKAPFTTSADYQAALKRFHQEGADSLISVVASRNFLWAEAGTSLNFDTNQRPHPSDIKEQLIETGAFYMTRVGAIVEHKSRTSGKTLLYKMPAYTAWDLNQPMAWQIGAQIMKHHLLESPKLEGLSSIKLVVSDVDGVMTDGSMYYTDHGDEIKRFHTYDGMAFGLMKAQGIKTALITSEDTMMVANRAKKLKIDYLYQGRRHGGKLAAIQDICAKENITLSQVVYIGDDINCREALSSVGFAFCPANALPDIKQLPNVIQLQRKGGEGVVREVYETYIRPNF